MAVNHSVGVLRNHRYMNAQHYKETIGERIKRLRIAAGLTQEQVGVAVGVSRVAVSKWEGGDTKNLQVENLFALADLLGVNEREMWRGIAAAEKVAPVTASQNVKRLPKRQDKRVAEAVKLLEETDDRGKDIALAGMKGALAGYTPKAKANRSN